MFPKGIGYNGSESDNLLLKTKPFFSYTNRLGCFSCLQKLTSYLLCEHWKFIVLVKWRMSIFRQGVIEVIIPKQQFSKYGHKTSCSSCITWKLVGNANSLVSTSPTESETLRVGPRQILRINVLRVTLTGQMSDKEDNVITYLLHI